VIPTEVRRQANTCTIRGRRQNGEIATSSVVSIVTVSTVAQSSVKKGIKAVGVCYQVETYMNEGHDSRRKLRCGRGDIVNKCGRMPKCGYCSGHHWTGDHKCNDVGCTAKQRSLAATCWRSALIAKEITSQSLSGAGRRGIPPKRRS
jgi:hypothetical protein